MLLSFIRILSTHLVDISVQRLNMLRIWDHNYNVVE